MTKPKALFKYCKINDNTIDMLKNEYIYLCPAYKLDDQFEARINFSIEYLKNPDNFKKYQSKMIKRLTMRLAEMCGNKELGKRAYKNIKAQPDLISAFIKCVKENCEGPISTFQLNYVIAQLSALMDLDPKYEEEFNHYLTGLIDLPDRVGIGSLAMENTNQVMWTMYAENYSGCCIKYKFKESDNVLPVKYTNLRQLDPIEISITSALERALSNNLKNDLFHAFINDLLTTKNREWRFQKEWRIIGESNAKYPLQIEAIYLGRNIEIKKREELLLISKECGYAIFEQQDDYQTLQVKFNQINCS